MIRKTGCWLADLDAEQRVGHEVDVARVVGGGGGDRVADEDVAAAARRQTEDEKSGDAGSAELQHVGLGADNRL